MFFSDGRQDSISFDVHSSLFCYLSLTTLSPLFYIFSCVVMAHYLRKGCRLHLCNYVNLKCKPLTVTTHTHTHAGGSALVFVLFLLALITGYFQNFSSHVFYFIDNFIYVACLKRSTGGWYIGSDEESTLIISCPSYYIIVISSLLPLRAGFQRQ